MKTRIQKHTLPFVASCALVTTFLFPGTTSATEWAASAGRPQYSVDSTCWKVTWSGFVNICGQGSSATKKLVVPVHDIWNAWAGSSVSAYGQFQQSAGAWVSCIGVVYSPADGTYNVTNRGTTSHSTAQGELLTLGALLNPSLYDNGKYFDCDVTYGGAVYFVEYHQ
jgi:hypothetical protein